MPEAVLSPAIFNLSHIPLLACARARTGSPVLVDAEHIS